MNHLPVLDFWVSTSIFLSGQSKQPEQSQGKLLHDLVAERELMANEDDHDSKMVHLPRRDQPAVAC